MHPDIRQARSDSCKFPTGVQNPQNPSALVGQDKLRVLSPSLINNPSSDRVQHNDTLLRVLGFELVVAWQNEQTRFKFWNLHFPVPSELADFLLPAAGIDLIQGHPLQVARTGMVNVW
jgi:hypothetical protein